MKSKSPLHDLKEKKLSRSLKAWRKGHNKVVRLFPVFKKGRRRALPDFSSPEQEDRGRDVTQLAGEDQNNNDNLHYFRLPRL